MQVGAGPSLERCGTSDLLSPPDFTTVCTVGNQQAESSRTLMSSVTQHHSQDRFCPLQHKVSQLVTSTQTLVSRRRRVFTRWPLSTSFSRPVAPFPPSVLYCERCTFSHSSQRQEIRLFMHTIFVIYSNFTARVRVARSSTRYIWMRYSHTTGYSIDPSKGYCTSNRYFADPFIHTTTVVYTSRASSNATDGAQLQFKKRAKAPYLELPMRFQELVPLFKISLQPRSLSSSSSSRSSFLSITGRTHSPLATNSSA